LVAVSIRYEHSQHFRVPAAEAFAWCTDYSAEDHALMGNKGSRRFTRLSEDTVILDDTVYPSGKPVRKTKLVRTDAKRLSYYNIHLTGPNRHSLYFYRISPEGDGSRLDFTGYEVSYPKKAPTKEQLAEMAKAEVASGRRSWGNLAKAMERELRGKRS
jgi:Polyketide cyclase / dehydrase and lipid transport